MFCLLFYMRYGCINAILMFVFSQILFIIIDDILLYNENELKQNKLHSDKSKFILCVINVVLQKTKYDKERPLLMTKINKLESLCRAMQAERQARKLLENEKIGKLLKTSLFCRCFQ